MISWAGISAEPGRFLTNTLVSKIIQHLMSLHFMQTGLPILSDSITGYKNIHITTECDDVGTRM